MTYITKDTNIKKFSEDYNEILKQLSISLDGTETDDSKKKSTLLKTLLDERIKINKEKEDLEKEVQDKKKQKDQLKILVEHKKGVDQETKRILGLNNPDVDKSTWEDSWNDFHSATTTNHYDWDVRIEVHYPTTYQDNLYKVKEQLFDTTEEQAISLLARTIVELAKIDKADLVANHGITDVAEKAKFENQFDFIVSQAVAINNLNKKGTDDLAVKTWDLPQTYTRNQSIGANVARVTHPFDFEAVFELISKLDDTLVDKLKQDNITKTETWKILKSGNAYIAEELKDYGIILADGEKTTIYKPSQDKHEIKITNGLKDWVNLVNLVFENENNRNKIIASFTNSPNQQLFTDLRTQTDIDEPFNTHFRLPESLVAIEELETDLESDILASALERANLNKEIQTARNTIGQKVTEIKTKDNSLDTTITELITKKRETLKTYHIEKGFADIDGGDDNRKTVIELVNIRELILEIRFLENNGNATRPSSQLVENTALIEATDLLDKHGYNGVGSRISLFKDYGFKKVGDSYEIDIEQAIDLIKKDTSMGNLDDYLQEFKDKETEVKLDNFETKAKEAIEKELGKEPNMNKLKDWQTKLKTTDTTLDSSVITETWKNQWNDVNNFKTVDKVKGLFETAKKTGATTGEEYKDFFETIKKGEAGYEDGKDVDTFVKLVAKTPQQMITLLKKYEYDNMDDAGDDKVKPRTQMERKIKKVLGKTSDHVLTSDEVKDAVYKVAVGELTLNDKPLKTDLSEYAIENDSDDTGKWYWPKSTLGKVGIVGGITVVIVGIIAFFYWKEIKDWWSGENDDNEFPDEELKRTVKVK